MRLLAEGRKLASNLLSFIFNGLRVVILAKAVDRRIREPSVGSEVQQPEG
jgi:hypothetical protein